MTTTARAWTSYRQACVPAAEWLAVGVAVSLPWSTSATGILVALWLLAVLPTLDGATLRRALATAAGDLPVLLWVIAVVGMLWAGVSWNERFGGLDGFNKLLIIPLLLAQFRRSAHGERVLHGYLVSVVGLLALSWALALLPHLSWRGKFNGVPVKDYIIQSEEFLICAFALLAYAFDHGRARRWSSAAALGALAVLLLADIIFVATGRTTLLLAPVLVLLLGWRQFRWRGLLGAALLASVAGLAAAAASPYLHARLLTSVRELQAYRANDAPNSTALHLELLRKSVSSIATAPVIGHGTGSIPQQFGNAAIGQTGASAVTGANPHNQFFAVAIQLGLVGAAALLAMWAAHGLLFRGSELTQWIGVIIVIQNVVCSLVNSHLFDFTQGWTYVFGVGVAGGMVLRQRDLAAAGRRSAVASRPDLADVVEAAPHC